MFMVTSMWSRNHVSPASFRWTDHVCTQRTWDDAHPKRRPELWSISVALLQSKKLIKELFCLNVSTDLELRETWGQKMITWHLWRKNSEMVKDRTTSCDSQMGLEAPRGVELLSFCRICFRCMLTVSDSFLFCSVNRWERRKGDDRAAKMQLFYFIIVGVLLSYPSLPVVQTLLIWTKTDDVDHSVLEQKQSWLNHDT